MKYQKINEKNQYLMTFFFCAVRLGLPQKGQQSSHCHFMIENTFTGIKTSCSVSHLEFLCIPFHTISSILRLINNSVKKLRFFTDRTNINVKAFHRKTTHLCLAFTDQNQLQSLFCPTSPLAAADSAERNECARAFSRIFCALSNRL